MPVLFDRTCLLCGRVLSAEKRSARCVRTVRARYARNTGITANFPSPVQTARRRRSAIAAQSKKRCIASNSAADRSMPHGSPPKWRRFSPRSSTGGSPPASHTCRSAFSAHGSAATIRLSCSRVRSRNHSRCPVFPRCASVRLPPVSPCSRTPPPAGRMPPARSCPGAFRSQASASWSSTISSRPARPPQTPRTSCAAWRRLCFRARGRKNRGLNRFSPSPSLLSFVYSL